MARDTEWELLSEADQRWLATQIHQLVPSLDDHRRGAWAHKLIDALLWFWTADAVHPTNGHIQRDAVKHDPRYIHHTNAALRSLSEGFSMEDDKVQHEHAGERMEIIEVLRKHGKTVEDVCEILRALNVAVLVTKQEHRALGKRVWGDEWRARKWSSHYEARDIAINPPTQKR
jgi:hypothetical protein